jgi:SNF2 family DNA or RNA helicase
VIVEKILARFHPNDEEKKEDLYLVKLKFFSYLHTRIVNEEVIIRDGQAGRLRMQRFLAHNPVHYRLEEKDERTFSPAAYKSIDRILAAQTSVDGDDGEMEYLIKWNQLPYSACTWEFHSDLVASNGEDVLQQKIEIFKRNNTLPSKPESKFDVSNWKPYKESPVFKLPKQKLHPWQIEGVNWLLFNAFNKRGSILADEMGLGKTLQTISTINLLWNEYGLKPALIMAPVSTLPHWKREIESWTNLNVVVFHGNRVDRDFIRFYEWPYWNSEGVAIKGQCKFDILLCSYEVVLAEPAWIGSVHWSMLVVDEAHRLKNWKSKLNYAIRENLNYDHCILLTGTPIQNGLDELWSLLNIACPNDFSLPQRSHFLSQFGGEERASEKLTNDDINKLQNILKPYLLRRLKEEVAGNSIPPKEETIIECELTSLQKQYYRAVLERNRQFLYAGCQSHNVPQLINISMQLRKVCNHPFLVEGVEQKILQERGALTPEQILESYIQSSGKLVLIDKLLPKLQQGEHKVLIFSQLKIMLDVLAYYLYLRGISFERIDGDTSSLKRQAAIDRFSSPDSESFVFLLCTRAGGVGINLAAADTVIIYDSDWNPQNDLQAQARAHRIGQTSKVKVYRLITSKTYEKQMFIKASLKLGLDQAVLSNLTESVTSNSDLSKKLSGEEIEQLLKYGAYDMLADEEASEAASKKFCEQDIDEILEQRSTVLTIPGTNSSSANEGGFSKATFAVSDEAEAVDVNASDFWEKILPDTESVSYLSKVASSAESSEVFNDDFFSKLAIHAEYCESPSAPLKDKNETLNLLRYLNESELINPLKKSQLVQWIENIQNPRRKTRKKDATIENEDGDPQDDDNWFDADFNAASVSAEDMYRFILRDAIISYLGSGRSDTEVWSEILNVCKILINASGLVNQELLVEDVQRFAFIVFEALSRSSEVDMHVKLFQEVLENIKNLMPTEDTGVMKDQTLKVSADWLALNVTRLAKRWASICRNGQRFRLENQYLNDYPDMKIDLSEVVIDSSFPKWWSSDYDWKLFKAVLKYGGHPRCFLLMKYDKTLEFGSDILSPDCPSDRTLEARTRVLIEAISKQRFHELRRLDKVKKERNREEVLKARMEKMEIAWTKKEKKSFQKFLHVYGPFQMNKIKDAGELFNKTIERVAEYYPKYYAQCLYMFRSGWTPSGEGGSSGALFVAPEEILNELHVIEHRYCTCNSSAGRGLHDMTCCRSCLKWFHSECVDFNEFANPEIVWICSDCKETGTTQIFVNPIRLRTPSKCPLPLNYRESCLKVLRELSDRIEISVIKSNLESGAYETLIDFAEEVRLLIRNVRILHFKSVASMNIISSEIYDVSDVFEDHLQEMMAQLLKPEIVDQYVSQKMARKTLERVELFENLMRAIHDPVSLYSKICTHVTKVDTVLPSYWTPAVHDMVLLLSVQKYGFGDTEGPLLDPEILEILKNCESTSIEVQIADLKELFVDQPPLWKRLVYVLNSISETVMEFATLEQEDSIPPQILPMSPPPAPISSSVPAFTATSSTDSSSTSKSNNKGAVNRDIKRDDSGNIVFPILAKGGATIWSLGTVIYDRKKYHSKNYIWPIGFRSTRYNLSYIKPEDRVEYISEIRDGGESPIFAVIASDDPDNPILNISATGAWTIMMQRIVDAKDSKRPSKISVSGPEMYGYSDIRLKKLIEELPGAEYCKGYVPIARK